MTCDSMPGVASGPCPGRDGCGLPVSPTRVFHRKQNLTLLLVAAPCAGISTSLLPVRTVSRYPGTLPGGQPPDTRHGWTRTELGGVQRPSLVSGYLCPRLVAEGGRTPTRQGRGAPAAVRGPPARTITELLAWTAAKARGPSQIFPRCVSNCSYTDPRLAVVLSQSATKAFKSDHSPGYACDLS